jgi:hypothetical protein
MKKKKFQKDGYNFEKLIVLNPSDNTRRTIDSPINLMTKEQLKKLDKANYPNYLKVNEEKAQIANRNKRIKLADKARKEDEKNTFLGMGFSSLENMALRASVLGDRMRFFPNENSLLDVINPLKFIGDLAGNVGQIPLNVKEGNYGQAALNLGIPLVTGAIGGIGTRNTAQFVNNVFNPFVDVNNLVKQGTKTIGVNIGENINSLGRLLPSGSLKSNIRAIGMGVRDVSQGRPFFETFPITSSQKRVIENRQDEEFKKGVDFVKNWAYGKSSNPFIKNNNTLRPEVEKRINNINPDILRSKFSNADLSTAVNPFNVYENLLVNNKKSFLNKDSRLTEDAKEFIINNKGTIGGVNTGEGQSITLRNEGFYYHRPETIGEVAAHETAHTFQKLGNDISIAGDPSTIAETLATNHPDHLYQIANKNTTFGKYMGDAMVEPKKGKYVWAASPLEPHAELMAARFKAYDHYKNKIGDEKAMEMLQNPTDELLDKLIETKDLNRFFKPSTDNVIKRDILRNLPAFAPAAIGLGAASQVNEFKQKGGTINNNMKTIKLKSGKIVKAQMGLNWNYENSIVNRVPDFVNKAQKDFNYKEYGNPTVDTFNKPSSFISTKTETKRIPDYLNPNIMLGLNAISEGTGLLNRFKDEKEWARLHQASKAEGFTPNPRFYSGMEHVQNINPIMQSGGTVTLSSGKVIKLQGGGVQPVTGSTRADSVNIYNNALLLEDYFNKNNYIKRDLEKNKSRLLESLKREKTFLEKKKNEPLQTYNGLIPIDKVKKAKQEGINMAKNNIIKINNALNGNNVSNYIQNLENARKEFKKPSLDSGEYTNIKGNKIEEKAPYQEYYKPLNENQFYQRELSFGNLDLRSPMALYDKRIEPQSYSIFDSQDLNTNFSFQNKIKNAKNKTERNIIEKEYNKFINNKNTNTDRVEIYKYDPLAVMPFDMIPLDKQQQRIEKYGISGVPKEIIDAHPDWIKEYEKTQKNKYAVYSKDLQDDQKVINKKLFNVPISGSQQLNPLSIINTREIPEQDSLKVTEPIDYNQNKLNLTTSLPLKQGTYFTRENQLGELGGKRYVDKKTGKLIGEMKNGNFEYNPLWLEMNPDLNNEVAEFKKGGETFEDWYKTVPVEKNDTSSYNLRRAYELASKKQLNEFVNNPKSHLYTAYKNPQTGIYEFMKSKNHPTLNEELKWYNSNDKEAINFKKNYKLDTSGDYYKYVPMFKKGGCITLSSGKKVMQKGGDVEEDEVDYSDITFRMQEMENRFTEAFGPSKKQVEDVEDDEEDDDVDTEVLTNESKKGKKFNVDKNLKSSDSKINMNTLNKGLSIYGNLINEASKTYGVPSALLTGLLYQESRFNPNIEGPMTKYGRARGIAQFIDATAIEEGVDQFDPNSAIPGAARFLKKMYNKTGDWNLALASYNAGYGNVKKHNGIPPFKETINYVAIINKVADVLNKSKV